MRPGWLIPALVGAALAIAAGGYVVASRPGAAVAPLSTLNTPDFHALAFSPDNADVVFFGHHDGIKRSDDGGRTWQDLVAKRNFDAMGLAVGAGNPRQVYLAGHDIFQVSTDGGVSWQPVTHDLPGTDIHGFAMHPEDSNRLYAFVVGHGTFKSADGGRTWTQLPGRGPDGIMSLAVAGGQPEALYASSMGTLMRSIDAGEAWSSSGPAGAGDILSVAAHPAGAGVVYAGAERGLYKSADGGSTWASLPFPGTNVAVVAVSPARPSRVLALSVRDRRGLIYRSEDGGVTWNGS